MKDDDGAWFSAKSHGYGSGLPLRCQGWLVLAIYFAALIGSVFLLQHDMLLQFSIVLTLTILLLIVCAKTTRGGWRWRWGNEK